jgi:pimeloyl-ACP methyl ester carboxylesterase
VEGRAVFIHGLESSSRGTKARWLQARFPDMLIPDFYGGLPERLERLHRLLAGRRQLILIGSSFGGLMAAIYALEHGRDLTRTVLLAPALNFAEFSPYRGRKTAVPAWLFIGRRDAVCPPQTIIPAARDCFADLCVQETDDDHFLHRTFSAIAWSELLQ